MRFLKERIGKLVEVLGEMIYPYEYRIPVWHMKKTMEKYTDLAGLDTASWELLPEGQIWGGHNEYFWFETKVTIPEEMDGKCVMFRLLTGREGQWDATNPQFSLFVNGKRVQGMDVNHTEAVVAPCARAGETMRILLSAFTGVQNFRLEFNASLLELDQKTEEFYYDVKVPYEVARLLLEDGDDYYQIISSLNEALNLVDLRSGHSQRYYDSLEKAQAYLTEEFYGKVCGEKREKIFCVGHTHIDVAWQWTLAVTRDKAVRSFSTVLELMRRYPEYIFMSSQPQLYEYVKENAPDVYEEIRDRVKEGRWEPEGGMWLEADCNLSSGESFVRQFLYGQRFFEKEFGRTTEILWLPDVFGYSAALPQIMDKCGIRYFMTTKINWNEYNQMPADTFLWEGIDGTRKLTHFISTREHEKGAAQGENMNSFFTTYNGYLAPSEVMGGWKRYQQRYVNQEALMSFGYGDGGGGPVRAELENQRRIARGLPGCPQTVMCTAGEFFHTLEEHVKDSKYLPLWVGELYLEYHRGTYTSMARNKKYNRRSEYTYQNAEFYQWLSWLLTGGEYRKDLLDKGWKTILLNQFHDILPGSSIWEVYEESKEQYEEILKAGGEMIQNSIQRIADQIGEQEGDVVVFHAGGFRTDALVEVECPENIAHPVVTDRGHALPTQVNPDGKLLFLASGVPARGYKTFHICEEGTEKRLSTDACEASEAAGENLGGTEAKWPEVSEHSLENQFFYIELAENGEFSRIYDKKARREILPEGKRGNVLLTFEDRPHNYDAWDINNYYTEKSWPVDEIQSIEVVEQGSVRATVEIIRPYLNSVIRQYISIYRDVPRIDIHNEIDWKEDHVLLRAYFPVDVHAEEASFDIQYGNVKRPTHANTSWDQAKFEMCTHKWVDVSEEGYGVSLLNDCKYGCSVGNGEIGISLLKSATYPNPAADKEHHSFTYSLYPHSGTWKQADTVRQAYELNNPAVAVRKQKPGGTLPGEYALIASSDSNVVIEAVKRAEDGDCLVVRVYEDHNRRTDAVLTFARPVIRAKECDMLERVTGDVQIEDCNIRFCIKPYEIKTFLIELK